MYGEKIQHKGLQCPRKNGARYNCYIYNYCLIHYCLYQPELWTRILEGSLL